jgi:exodeoxyribonuclease VII small subunit
MVNNVECGRGRRGPAAEPAVARRPLLRLAGSGMAKLPKNLKFEEAMQRLDAIVAAMESGEIGIEESLDRYEEAMQLAARCREILDQAEQRIQKIQLDASGKPHAEPFEPAVEEPGSPEDEGEVEA